MKVIALLRLLNLYGLLVVLVSSRALLASNSSWDLIETRAASDDDDVGPPPCFILDGSPPGVQAISHHRRTLSSAKYARDGLSYDDYGHESATNYTEHVERHVLDPTIGIIPALTEGEIDTFMVQQTDRPGMIGLLWDSPEGWDQSTSLYRSFGQKSFSIGAEWMRGCTAMFVISKYGIWGAHYWERLAFSNSKSYRALPDWKFEKWALNNILGAEPCDAAGPTLKKTRKWLVHNPRERDNKVQAVMMTPRELPAKRGQKGRLGHLMYPKRIDQLKRAINQVIEQVAVDESDVYDYVPVGITHVNQKKNKQLDTTARGRILVQYDPNSDGEGQKGVRLIFERAIYPFGHLLERLL